MNNIPSNTLNVMIGVNMASTALPLDSGPVGNMAGGNMTLGALSMGGGISVSTGTSSVV